MHWILCCTRHIISCLHNRIISKSSFFRHHVVISRILLVTYSYQWLALLIQLQKLIIITIQHLFIEIIISELFFICLTLLTIATKRFVYAQHAAASTDVVVIKSSDTDVFLIGVACQPTIPARLIFDTETANNWRRVNISHVAGFWT